MANLDETGAAGYNWEEEGVYQLEITDRVQAGAGGIANRQASELANRTRNLHDRLSSAEVNKADLDSPEFAGTPKVPTADINDNSTRAASTAFVQAIVDALINGAPGVLDSFMEFATALGNDPNFATTITNALALKAPKASPALTGVPTAPTAGAGTNSTQIATTAFVQAALTALGLDGIFNSPVFTGIPTTPTAGAGTNTQQVASTAFVQAAIAALLDSAPGTLDTLNELAAALGDDPNFATTMTNALAGKCANNDARLSDARTPIDNSVSTDKLATRYKSSIDLGAGTEIDWSLGSEFTKVLTADTTFTFTNLHAGVKTLNLVGDFAVVLPAGFNYSGGERDAENEYSVEIKCTNPATPKGRYFFLKDE